MRGVYPLKHGLKIADEMPMKEGYRSLVLDNLTTATVLVDRNSLVVDINSAAEVMLGASNSRVAGQNISSLLIDATGEFSHRLQTTLTSNQSYAEREKIFRVIGGDEVTVDVTVIPVVIEDEVEYVLIEIITMDRPLRIMREKILITEHQATRSMLRGLAHEIKNPLGGLRGAAQLLESELDSNELKEYTQIIVSEADRLHALVDRMLGPNMLPNKVETNIHRVLQHVKGLVEVEGQKNIRFYFDYDPSIPRILLDRDMLIQAILNLVRNSMRALGDEGAITFKTRILRRFTIGQVQHKLVACISIIDNGPGIPEEIKSQIFYPMVSGQQQGTGLGLAISQMLIGQHNGLIEFDSEPGRTEFRVLLPLLVDTQSKGTIQEKVH